MSYRVTLYVEGATYDGFSDLIVRSCSYDTGYFASIIMDDFSCGKLLREFNRRNTVSIRGNGDYMTFNKSDCAVISQKLGHGFSHVIFQRKIISERESRFINCAIFVRTDDKLEEARSTCVAPEAYNRALFRAIRGNTSIPILKEWVPYIASEFLKDKRFHKAIVTRAPNSKRDYGFKEVVELIASHANIMDIIREGLKRKKISVDGCNAMSETLAKIEGLDSYQKAFGDVLSRHTREAFRPKFDPTTSHVGKDVEGFYEVCRYYVPDIQSYQVQKNVIQGVKNHLRKNKNALISGQTGSGKTLMAIGAVCVSAKRKDYSALAMVPSGLVNRWVKAIEATIPNAEIHVVSYIDEFIRATKDIRCSNRRRPLWIVMSENTAKINYEEHPAVIWNKHTREYKCPHCMSRIEIDNDRSISGERIYSRNKNATDLDFLTQDDTNIKCETCKGKLWMAATKKNSKNWVKLNKCGWVHRERIPELKETLTQMLNGGLSDGAPKTLRQKYEKILSSISEYELRGTIAKYPKRYNIGHYIRKHLKNAFDFGIFDEVHTLAGDSQQGAAFGNICQSVKKGIFLTGTLSNGYAYGFFHLLFRTQTRAMLDAGFNYDDIKKFTEKYGVKEETVIKRGNYIGIGRNRRFQIAKKRKHTENKPGISPTLYVDFLMENTVTVSKKDIRKNLCKYTEVPVPITMDRELRESYETIVQDFGDSIRAGIQISRGDIRNSILKANMFLDQPYGLDIRDTNDEFLELDEETVRPKEQKLIDICKERAAEGEKILVYCEYTMRLNIINRLVSLLSDNGVRTIGMDTSIDKNKRQEWLEEKAKDGIDAVVLNPALVGTGLNLLDYTTIIFYQTSTKVTTIRQASQRSNRINQENPVTVYFLYYDDSIQSSILSLISQKLKAAKAIEGDFSETALQAMSDDTDIMTMLAASITKNENIKVDVSNFEGMEEGEKGIKNSDTPDNAVSTAMIQVPIFDNRPVIKFRPPQHVMNNLMIA